jgi:hypothetical protein
LNEILCFFVSSILDSSKHCDCGFDDCGHVEIW